jgi:hypothetical protein
LCKDEEQLAAGNECEGFRNLDQDLTQPDHTERQQSIDNCNKHPEQQKTISEKEKELEMMMEKNGKLRHRFRLTQIFLKQRRKTREYDQQFLQWHPEYREEYDKVYR